MAKEEVIPSYRLPNDKYTISQIRYLREWGKYNKRLEKIFTGYHVIGFDPRILIGNKSGIRSLDLTITECDLIFQAIDKKRT